MGHWVEGVSAGAERRKIALEERGGSGVGWGGEKMGWGERERERIG